MLALSAEDIKFVVPSTSRYHNINIIIILLKRCLLALWFFDWISFMIIIIRVPCTTILYDCFNDNRRRRRNFEIQCLRAFYYFVSRSLLIEYCFSTTNDYFVLAESLLRNAKLFTFNPTSGLHHMFRDSFRVYTLALHNIQRWILIFSQRVGKSILCTKTNFYGTTLSLPFFHVTRYDFDFGCLWNAF